MNLIELLVIAFLVLLNGVFAAYELALASVKPERLKALADAKRSGAKAALAMKGRMEASLAVVQLGITFFGAIAATLGGASFVDRLVPELEKFPGVGPVGGKILAIMLFVLPLGAVTIIVGELIPKTIGIRHADRVCRALSPMMQVFGYIAYPVVWIFEWITKRTTALVDRLFPAPPLDAQAGLSELRAQIGMLRTAKVIGVQQEQIMVQAARLSSMRVREIMLPAEDIVMLQADAPLTSNIVVAHLDLHTRFPVTEKANDPQAILGYVNFKEMMFLAKTHPTNPVLREIMRPIIRLPWDLPVSEALRRMVSDHVHLALVTDAAGRVMGMITQEDVFEELVGEIMDEFDRLPRNLTPSGRQWVVGGGALLGKLRETLARPDLSPALPNEASVNEWITRAMDRRPRGGDALKIDGVSVLVRKVRRHKVTEALLDPAGGAFPPADTQGLA